MPVRIRQAINIESGLNDGMALPVNKRLKAGLDEHELCHGFISEGLIRLFHLQGKVTLRSETELEDSQLAEVLLQAGFHLGAVNRMEAVTSQLQRRSVQPETVSVSTHRMKAR